MGSLPRAGLLVLLLVPGALEAAERVTWLHEGSPAPPALATALERLAAACEQGDRGAFTSLLAPASRPEAPALADAIVSGPSRALHDVRLEVVTLARRGPGWEGALLLHARAAAPPPATPLPPPPEGFARAEPGTRAAALLFEAEPAGEALLLSLRSGDAAPVTRLVAETRLDAKPPRARSHARLQLARAPRVVLLAVGSGASVRPAPGGPALTPIEGLLGAGSGAVRAEWPEGAARDALELDADVLLPDGAVRGGTIALLHQSQVIPFCGGDHFRYELVLDVPLPNRSVSVGQAEDLPAAEGRRRTRWTCDRAVDYLPMAAGPYEIAATGTGDERLELWRTREVGGDPAAILAELKELVDFQAAAIAPLPYRAFRLVELPTQQGLAVSYASMIFMTPDMLATRELRVEILSHEVGHQWWGNAVSPHPTARWAAEGMADAMKDLFVLRRFGEERWLDRQDAHRRNLVQGHGAGSRPLATSPGSSDAYDRGALFVHALRAELGDELFWRVLKRWYARLADVEPRTADFRREAEAEAGRPLGAIFDPWLGSTALPFLDLGWSADGRRVTVTVAQDEPAFVLDVPLRASAAGDRLEEWTLRTGGAVTTATRELAFTPDDVDLDPGHLLPRVLPGELDAWERAEAAACLARGDATRARAILERLQERSLLDATSALRLFAARVVTGVPAAEARRQLDVVLGELADPASRQAALLSAADELLEQGAAEAALPILEELDAEVTDGAAAPRRLGLALRALGREAEAQAAFRRALQRRPDDAETLAALGRPAAPAPDVARPVELTPLLAADDPLMKASSSDGMRAVALTGDRAAVLLAGARTLLTGLAGRLAKVPSFAPVGAIDVAVLADGGGGTSTIAVLEAARQKSRLTILDVAKDGSARVVAVHDRAPGGARGLAASADGGVLAAWLADGERWQWRRFRAPLRASSAGPDDDEGLRRIAPADDERWETAGTAGAGDVVDLPGLGLATIRDEGRRLASESGVAWESTGAADRVLVARPFRDGVALVMRSDPSASPFAEDRQEKLRLLAIAGDLVLERALPEGTLDASLASDGGLLVEATPRQESDARVLRGRLEPK